jgi:alanine racemase
VVIVDVTDLPDNPEALTLLGPHQSVDQLAEAAGTIGYEVLTALGPRYARSHAS